MPEFSGLPVAAEDNPEVVIAQNGYDSEAVDMRAQTLGAVFFPSGFQGTSVRIKASDTLDGTYSLIEDGNGNPMTITLSSSVTSDGAWVSLDAVKLSVYRFLKISAVTQQTGAARTLKLAGRRFS